MGWWQPAVLAVTGVLAWVLLREVWYARGCAGCVGDLQLPDDEPPDRETSAAASDRFDAGGSKSAGASPNE